MLLGLDALLRDDPLPSVRIDELNVEPISQGQR